MIALRSEKQLEQTERDTAETEDPKGAEEEDTASQIKMDDISCQDGRSTVIESIQSLSQRLQRSISEAFCSTTFIPQRLRKNNTDKQFYQFLIMFKKLHINISFADALAQMPKYAKL